MLRSKLQSRQAIAFTSFARLLFGLILSCTLLTILGFVVATIYHSQPDNRYYGLLLYTGTPEPKERATFVALILAAPIISWLSLRLVASVPDWAVRIIRPLAFTFLAVICAAEILIVSGSVFLHLATSTVSPHRYITMLATAGGVALALYVVTLPRGLASGGQITSWINASVLVFLGLVDAASRIHTLSTLEVPGWGQLHFEAVFYSVSQVANGKTLLANLPAQYGLYAELLRPALSGACTVFRFSMIMACLQLLAFLCLLFVGRMLIRSNLLFLLTGLAFSALVGEMWLYGINHTDPYYQYWPLRLIFPAISLVIFHLLLNRPNRQALVLALLAITAGIACIWNLDTGVPVFGAMFAYLVSRVVVPPHGTSRRRAIFLIAESITIYTLVLAAFFVYLRLKAGQPLQWKQLLEYQKVFYTAGINLLPMPVSFHPWVLVGCLYVTGIVIYISYLRKGVANRFSSMLCYVSILGIGLFAYYQGRSHEFVFTIVVWPAVLMGFALLDRIRRICAARLLPRACIVAAAPFVILGVLLGCSSLINLPAVARSVARNWAPEDVQSGAKLRDAVLFIRKHTSPARRAIILSLEQSTYFGEANLASAIDGPGLVEMVFRRDMDHFNQAIVDARDTPVFVELDDSGQLAASWRWLLNTYEVAESSPLKAIARMKLIGRGPSLPMAVSMTPNSGRGVSQTFTARFSDTAGAKDILASRVLINSSLSGISGCFLYFYGGASNVLYLLSDVGAQRSGIAIGRPGTLSNSQCTVNVGASSAVFSGNTLTLNLAMKFAPSFTGAKNIYIEAQSATVTGAWRQLGAWIR